MPSIFAASGYRRGLKPVFIWELTAALKRRSSTVLRGLASGSIKTNCSVNGSQNQEQGQRQRTGVSVLHERRCFA
jgi:hypothetical protein